MTFTFTDDFKNEFKHYVNVLFMDAKKGFLDDRQARMKKIDSLIESYIAATGQRPDIVQLDRLATLCLREELTDRHPDKMSREEFPIMSDEQYVRRKTGLNRKKDGRGIIETSFKLAEEYGTDGRNYRRPKRKKREW
jgi:hypothetical protein